MSEVRFHISTLKIYAQGRLKNIQETNERRIERSEVSSGANYALESFT